MDSYITRLTVIKWYSLKLIPVYCLLNFKILPCILWCTLARLHGMYTGIFVFAQFKMCILSCLLYA